MIYSDLFKDVTKFAKKLPTSDYQEKGKHPIIDQGQKQIAGYTDIEEGLFTDVPAIIFGDHTRVIKHIDVPFFIGADGVKVIKCKEEQANYNYLFYLLSSVRIPNTGYNRHYKWLKEARLVEHTKEEQEKIVAVLSTIDNILDLYSAQLNKLDELIKSRFLEMFGDIGTNSKGWLLSPLEEVAEIHIGPFGSLLHKEDYVCNCHALVNPSHIVDGKIKTDEKLTINNEKYQEMSAYHLQKDDIVLGRRGEMGRCAVVEQEGLLCGTGSMIIRPNGKIIPYFLQTILSSPLYKRILEDKAVGVTMLNLNVPIVSSITIPLLPIELQDRFIELLQSVEKQKATVQQSIDKLETLKQSLMQEYFG